MSDPSLLNSNSAAYRVASLLRRDDSTATTENDASSLRALTAQIESFLATAPTVAAVPMEPTVSEGPDSCAVGGSGATPYVELNVVAGVFEDKAPSSSAMGGILLPTAEVELELGRRRAEEAQAMLDLMSALTPSASPSHMIEEVPRHQGGDKDESSDDEVVIVDADDMMGSSSDDDIPAAQRRRIVEM